MHFSPKRGLLMSIFVLVMISFIWWQFFISAQKELINITAGKLSVISISVIIIIIGFCLGVFLTWLAVSCRYTITEDYLIAQMGPIRQRIKLSEIEIVRWSGYFESDGGSMNTSSDSLCIRSTKNEMLKVSPKDTSCFLKLLRERCPNAEITTLETPPSLFSNTTKSAREQALDEKYATITNRWLVFYGIALSLVILFIFIILWYLRK